MSPLVIMHVKNLKKIIAKHGKKNKNYMMKEKIYQQMILQQVFMWYY